MVFAELNRALSSAQYQYDNQVPEEPQYPEMDSEEMAMRMANDQLKDITAKAELMGKPAGAKLDYVITQLVELLADKYYEDLEREK